jgi:dTDP-4-dehydrorhamnose reductase
MLGNRVHHTLLKNLATDADHNGVFTIGNDRLSINNIGNFNFTNFDYIINCIGVIRQRETCEKDPDNTIFINSLLPHLLAKNAPNTKIIHISTDCVFSGKEGHYTEESITDPDDFYGRTKVLGELITYPNALTLRTSIIGHEVGTAYGLLMWFLKQEGKMVKGFTNVYYTGVTTNYLADIISKLILEFPNLSGLYQIASPRISKYDLLCKIRDIYGLNINVVPNSTIESDKSLIDAKFRVATTYPIPSWDVLIQQMRDEGVAI